MTVTTDTDRTTTALTTTVLSTTDRTDIATEVRATAFPRREAEHAPNLATLDMLRSTGRNPLLLQASRRTRPSRQRDCGGSSTR